MSRNENGKAQASEKSSFTRRCSLLSRYLKEKGSFGNIDLGLHRKPDSVLGLPAKSDPLGNQIELQKAEPSEIKALDLTQKVSKGEPSTSSGGKVKDANIISLSESEEQGSSQLTIIFSGQVIAYNDFPADKAKEIIEIAKQAKLVTETNIQTQTNIENNNNNMVLLPDLNEPTNSEDSSQQQQNQVVERIARRASLHRFFAKRKDRAVARAPYQVNQNAGQHHQFPPKSKMVADQPLEPGQSSQQPDKTNVAQTVSHPKSNGDKYISMEIEQEDQCSKDLELRL